MIQKKSNLKRRDTKAQASSVWTKIGIISAIIILLVILGLVFNFRSSGKAVFFTGQPLIKTVDLTTEKELIFQTLPEDKVDAKINLTTGLNKAEEFDFTLTKTNENKYQFDLMKSGTLIARDVITTNVEGDTSIIFVDTIDSIPDLKVSYQNNMITVRDMHHIDPATAKIDLIKASNKTSVPQIMSMVIYLKAKQTFNGIINTTSKTGQPTINEIKTGNVIAKSEKKIGNSTSINYSFSPDKDGAYVLDIPVDVGGKITHGYYTFAVGDVIYGLKESNYPEIILKKDGTLTVELSATTDLQPLAVPCDLSSIPDNTNMQRIYGYDSSGKTVVVWNKGAPGNINKLDSFTGYFVELSKAEKTTLTFKDCKPKNLQPASAIPALGKLKDSITLEPKWQLFSLPGIVPQSLSDFGLDTSKIELHSCGIGYKCTKLDVNTPINPGKPYWILNKEPSQLKFNYVLE